MNISPHAIYPQNAHASINRGLKGLSSGELRSDLQPMARERDFDRIESFRQSVTSDFENIRLQSLDGHLQPHDVSRGYDGYPLDSELTQRPGTEGYPKESYGSQGSMPFIFGITYRVSTIQRRVSENDTLRAGTQIAEPSWSSGHRKSGHGHEAFVLLARAKRLLSEQRIEDARSTLEFGARQFPKDTGIARLLRAISPGQVTKVESSTMSNQEREIEWIRKHGINYRGQWVAIRSDELLVSATTLRSVLGKLKQRNHTDEEVLIQYIVPE